MRILDRYVLQKFFLPFMYCVLGFIAIWFIFDLSDNLPDFLQGKVGFDILTEYYKSQIPEIIVVSMPSWVSAVIAARAWTFGSSPKATRPINCDPAGVRWLNPGAIKGPKKNSAAGFAWLVVEEGRPVEWRIEAL